LETSASEYYLWLRNRRAISTITSAKVLWNFAEIKPADFPRRRSIRVSAIIGAQSTILGKPSLTSNYFIFRELQDRRQVAVLQPAIAPDLIQNC